MNSPKDSATEILSRLLRAPLPLTHASQRVFGAGPGARDTVISTSRLILVLEGALTYRLEEQVFCLDAGTEIFVPSWCRREWTVPAGGTCTIIWCEFEEDGVEFGNRQLFQRRLSTKELARERRGFTELLHSWNRFAGSGPGERILCGLEMEGQLKALLTRFFLNMEHARPRQRQAPAPHPMHSSIKHALRYLEAHFTEVDVLERQRDQCGLTPNYFRKRFREALSCSPGEYVKRLRMRQARYLLHATDWQLKRIAAEVGYPDKHYFSRTYRAFWGYPPNRERDAL